MRTAEKLKPGDLAESDCWPCWHAKGWEQAHEYSMVDASDGTTRAEAKARSVGEIGSWTEIGVWKRHVRFLTRQEAWERFAMNAPGAEDWPWSVVPDDWRPTEDDMVWEFVHRLDSDGRPYWVVGLIADGPPPRLIKPVAAVSEVTDTEEDA